MSNRVIPLDSDKSFKILSNNIGYDNPSIIIQGDNGNTGTYIDFYNTGAGDIATLGTISFSKNISSNRYDAAYIEGRCDDISNGKESYIDFYTKDTNGDTGNPMTIGPSYVKLNSEFRDSNDSPGTNGQILSSIGGTGTQWITSSGGGSTGLAGVLSISNTAGSTGIDMNNQDIYYINSIGNTGGTLDFGSNVNDNTTLTLGGTGTFKVLSSSNYAYSQPVLTIQSNASGTTGVYLDMYTNNDTGTGDEISSISFSSNTEAGGTKREYGRITGRVKAKGASGNGTTIMKVLKSGTMTTALTVDTDAVIVPFGLRDSGSQIGSNNQVLKNIGATGIQWSNTTGNGSGITYYIKQTNTSNTLTNSTTAQPLFKVSPSAGNTGTITGITAGVWDFEISAYLTGMASAARSLNFTMDSGTTAYNATSSYNSISHASSGIIPVATTQRFVNTYNTMAGSETIINSSTNTNMTIFIKGVIDTSNTINITPRIVLSGAPGNTTSTIVQGSYMKFTNISTTANSSFYVG